jgi:predicted O-methyltransferase YrrM
MSRLRGAAQSVLNDPKRMRIVDRTTALALRVGAPPFSFFTRVGPARLPASTESLRRMGIYPIRDHYYQPLFNDAHLTQPLSAVRELPGIDWRHADQVALLEQLQFAEELLALDLAADPRSDLDFSLSNPSFGAGDAEFLYSMVRHIKPRRVFEIGSGNSTKIARLALQRNATETGVECEHVCIEPYEAPWLEHLGVRVIRQRVQDLDLEFFDQLAANDLLFIDSSHVIRPQGDVLCEYLQVLPSLASGVFVHIHDIFSPRDYPERWIRESVRMWNEQYLLEALLGNTGRYAVVAALNYLKHAEYDRLSAVCPYLTSDREPGSFYLRIR